MLSTSHTTTPQLDAPRRTDDGLLWPVARAAMTTPEHITTRMAADIKRLAAVHGGVTEAELLHEGWTREQTFLHLIAAAGHLEREDQREARNRQQQKTQTESGRALETHLERLARMGEIGSTRLERMARDGAVAGIGLILIGLHDIARQFIAAGYLS